MRRTAVREQRPAGNDKPAAAAKARHLTAQDALGNRGVLSAATAESEAQGVAAATSAGRPAATVPGALGSSHGQGGVGPAVRRRIADARAEGWPLPPAHLGLLGAAGTSTLEHARVHTGARSGRLAGDLGAAAFTTGGDVFFAPGRWAPATHAGRRLLAHELTHVAQQRLLGPGRVVQRQELAPPPVSGRTPPESTLSATLSGLFFTAAPDARLGPAQVRTQYMALILFRLLGDRYTPELVTPALTHLAGFGMSFTGAWADPATLARAGEPYGVISLAPHISRELLRYLEAVGFELQITKEQRQILERGLAAEEAWAEIKALEQRGMQLLPEWFTQSMFDRAVAQRQELFEDYRLLVGAEPLKQVDDWRLDALYKLAASILAAARPLEDIRDDLALARDEKVGPVYRSLWQLEQADPAPSDPPPKELASEDLASSFVTWVVTQPRLAERSFSEHAARRMLLEQFANWVGRALVAIGDEVLTDRPTKMTDPPFDGRLTSSPPAQPPLYELSSDADARFFMHIHFPDVYDAFGQYVFVFERVRLDDVRPLTDEGVAGRGPSVDVDVARKKIAEVEAGRVRVRELPGEKPEAGEVAAQRFERVERYNEADIEAVVRELGPVGLPLIEANNALRYVGAGIRIGIEIITSPKRGNRAATHVKFPEPGLYVVMCVAAQVLRGGEEVARPPTVAYIPVLARPTGEIAEARARGSRATEEKYAELLPELRALRKMAWLPPDKLDPFKQLEEEIVAEQGGIGTTLELQLARLDKALKEIENLPYHPRRGPLRDELQHTKDLLTIRAARIAEVPGAKMKPLHASFVTYEGHTIPLRMEWTRVIRPFGSTNQHVYVSDLTTVGSGESPGEGATVEDAIADAVTKILKAPEGYGRGIAALSFGKDNVKRIPIDEVGLPALLPEAIDNISMVLSLAALAAAPFTGGASLVVMIPVGLAGAGTSAYRLLRRDEMNTLLRLDPQAAMDILNIVSGVVGVLRPAAAGLRLARFGKVLAVIGVGADKGGIMLMGAELAEQIERARQLPAEERDAELLMVLGNGLLQAGMLVGGELAEAANTQRAAKLRKKRGGSEEADPKRTRTEPQEKEAAAGRKTMAGPSRAEGQPAMSEAAGGRKPHGVGEDPLLETLARQGVRRDRRPPRADGPTLEPHSTFAKDIKSFDEALKIFNVALDESGGYEVAIVQNVKDGTYAVRVGDHAGVKAPTNDPYWQTRLHYHPNPENATRFWLPAPQDFAEMLERYDPDGPPQREMLQYEIPGVGRGLTEFGITPGAEKPFYVKIFLPDGSVNEMRFAHDGAFDAHWGSETIYVNPDSKLGKTMKADVDSFLSGLPDDARRKTMAGPRAKAPGKPPPRLLDRTTGQLTDEGVAFVRKIKGYEGLDSDAKVRQRFAQKGDALQIVVGEELRRGHAAGETRAALIAPTPGAKAFAEPPAGTPKQGTEPTMNNVFEELARLLGQAKPGAKVDTSVLDRPIGEIVDGDAELSKIRQDYEESDNPDERRAWALFYYGSELKGLPPRKPNQPPVPLPMDRGYFLKNLKRMKPDAVEVWPADGKAWVYDITQRPNDPFHGFKTRLYAVAIALATGMTVEAEDYRAPLRQRPH